MKFAVLALLGLVSGIKYPVSEGPTKADNGENDDDVIPRNDEMPKWGDPLKWKDGGDDDSVVLTMLDGSMIRPRKIYDEDGDGVEDNVHKTRDELDRFYIPNRYFPTEEVYNTHHGNLPGHVRKEEYEAEPEWDDPWKGHKWFTNIGDIKVRI